MSWLIIITPLGIIPEPNTTGVSTCHTLTNLLNVILSLVYTERQHRPDRLPSPVPVLSGDGFQNWRKGFSDSPCPPSCLTVDISLSRIDFLCVWSDEYTSLSEVVVSWLVTTLPSSGYLPVYWVSCLSEAFPTDILSRVSEGYLRLTGMGLGESPRRWTRWTTQRRGLWSGCLSKVRAATRSVRRLVGREVILKFYYNRINKDEG